MHNDKMMELKIIRPSGIGHTLTIDSVHNVLDFLGLRICEIQRVAHLAGVQCTPKFVYNRDSSIREVHIPINGEQHIFRISEYKG